MITRAAKIIATLAVLGLALYWSGPGDVLARLQGARPEWLLLCLMGLTAATFSMARRWQLTARHLGLEMGFADGVREYYLAQFINTVLPGGVIGDAGRAIRAKDRADLKRAAQSVIAERVMGQLAMVLIMAVGFGLALSLPGGFAWPAATPVIVAAAWVLGLGALIIMARVTALRARFQFISQLLRDRAIGGHAILASALLILSLYAAARATGTVIPLEGLVTVLPIVFVAMVIPLTIGGWGWREGAAAALFPVFGASPSAGVAMGVGYGAMMFLAALPALFMILSGSVTLRPQAKA